MDRSRRRLLGAGGGVLATALAGCSLPIPGSDDGRDDEQTAASVGDVPTATPIDDWQFDPDDFYGDDGSSGGHSGTGTPMATSAPSSAGGDVGLAAGGAKSIANFRNNVEEGYLPIPEDLSYEGLFYGYYFDTAGGPCSGTFCPRYSTAISPDPLSGEPERYLRVGLDSGLDAFERKPLNLVVVLDVSGSMSASFDEYYYDRFGNRKEVENYTGRPKIDVATDVIASMTTHLRDEDRFGMVVFNDEAAVAKPVRRVDATDMAAIRRHIRELQADGGTRMSAGIDVATDLLSEYDDQDRTERETRTIFVTDAMANLGETDDDGLLSTLRDNADRHHYTTFVGVGVDFNAELVDAITAVEGANYYPVHSTDRFEQLLDDEFRYMVTPLVFDLSLTLHAGNYDVAKVYGTTAAEDATAELVAANTLFPSPKREGKAKGGVILVQIDGEGGDDLVLEAEWTTRDGRTRRATADVRFPATSSRHFGDTAVRKAVLLSRYADLLKNWMVYERDRTAVAADGGISVPPEHPELGKWERQSRELVVSERYEERIGEFADHLEREMTAIGDDALQRELEILRTLADHDG